MKPITLLFPLLALAACAEPPLKRIRPQDQIIIERSDTKVCQVDGKVWSQTAGKECAP